MALVYQVMASLRLPEVRALLPWDLYCSASVLVLMVLCVVCCVFL